MTIVPLIIKNLVLFREKGGKNRAVFKAPDGKEITIPAMNITGVNIISKKGLHKDDLMVQLDCKDGQGRNLRLIFNVNDDIIRGVMAGIDELAGEDTVLRSFEEMTVTTEVKYCVSCGTQIPKTAGFCSSCGQKQ